MAFTTVGGRRSSATFERPVRPRCRASPARSGCIRRLQVDEGRVLDHALERNLCTFSFGVQRRPNVRFEQYPRVLDRTHGFLKPWNVRRWILGVEPRNQERASVSEHVLGASSTEPGTLA